MNLPQFILDQVHNDEVSRSHKRKFVDTYDTILINDGMGSSNIIHISNGKHLTTSERISLNTSITFELGRSNLKRNELYLEKGRADSVAALHGVCFRTVRRIWADWLAGKVDAHVPSGRPVRLNPELEHEISTTNYENRYKLTYRGLSAALEERGVCSKSPYHH